MTIGLILISVRNELYLPVGAGKAVLAFGLSDDAYQQAVSYKQELATLDNPNWEGSFEHELTVLSGKGKRGTPAVIIEVTNEEIQFVEKTHDGPRKIDIYHGSLDNEEPLFSSMLLYYFLDDRARAVNEANVWNALQSTAARNEWNTAVANAKTDSDRFTDS